MLFSIYCLLFRFGCQPTRSQKFLMIVTFPGRNTMENPGPKKSSKEIILWLYNIMNWASGVENGFSWKSSAHQSLTS